ncbi:unnamed protein product, partial [Arabidopsis halleri]
MKKPSIHLKERILSCIFYLPIFFFMHYYILERYF